MFELALYQPEIPQNTGNIIRLAANTGITLHLIHPLGFTWDDKRLRRAGLDYHEFAKVQHHHCWEDFLHAHATRPIYAVTTHATMSYHQPHYPKNTILLFGPETRGLPPHIRQHYPAIRIPMLADRRSLNLSNAVAIVSYELWKQNGFTGATL